MTRFRPDGSRPVRFFRFGIATLAAGIALPLLFAGSPPPVATEELRFTDVVKDTKRFIGYSDSIVLTPQEEAIKAEALEALPAPCCSKYTAYTCCCACNMAKSIWGLSHFAIKYGKLDANKTRAKVAQWTHFINPEGFSGDSCFKGGCGRPFAANGCGGMDATRVVF